MELLNILEQSVDYNNWNATAPSDYSYPSTKYDYRVVTINGQMVAQYKLKTTTPAIDLNQFIGTYKEGAISPKVTVEDGKLRLTGLKVIDVYLESRGGDKFGFDFGGEGAITFKRDSSGKVNSFDYKWRLLNGTAVKEGANIPTPTATPAPTNSQPQPTPAPSEKPQTIQYTKYNGKSTESRNTEGFQWKKCDNTFPIKYGCSNDYILEMNTCIFGENSSSVFGPALMRAMQSRSQDMSKKEITKEMYDKIIELCQEHKDEVAVNENKIKEVVKIILNQELLGN